MLLALDTILPGFWRANSASVYHTQQFHRTAQLSSIVNTSTAYRLKGKVHCCGCTTKLITTVNIINWYGHVLRKDNEWVKKCMEYEAEGPRPGGRLKRTWTEVVEKDCQTCKLNKEDATDRSRWRKLIKDVWWSGWVWVGECFFWYRPTRVDRVPNKGLLNSCVCV